MKATGIVRHVDDLGRIVIPREIRRSLGIDGEPLEIYLSDDHKSIILTPYRPLKEEEIAADLEALANFYEDNDCQAQAKKIRKTKSTLLKSAKD